MSVSRVNVALPAIDPADSPTPPAGGEGEPAVRPDYIPEKFWDAETGKPRLEAAFTSYSELERKQSGAPADPAPAVEPSAEPAAPTEGLFTAEKMAEYGAAVAAGGLTAEQTAAFAEANIPQEIVDRFVGTISDGSNAIDTAVIDVLGSRENFDAASGWLTENGTPAQIDAYNDAINSGSEGVARMAAENLKRMHGAATSAPPTSRVNGTSTPVTTGPELFQGWGDVTESVNNPLYKTSESFRAQHMARLKASSAAGKI